MSLGVAGCSTPFCSLDGSGQLLCRHTKIDGLLEGAHMHSKFQVFLCLWCIYLPLFVSMDVEHIITILPKNINLVEFVFPFLIVLFLANDLNLFLGCLTLSVSFHLFINIFWVSFFFRSLKRKQQNMRLDVFLSYLE